MDLSAAYGAAFSAAALGMAAEVVPPTTAATVASQESVPVLTDEVEGIVPVAPRRKPMHRHGRSSGGDIYSIHVEIGREEAHMLCLFIAVFILSLLFSARR